LLQGNHLRYFSNAEKVLVMKGDDTRGIVKGGTYF